VAVLPEVDVMPTCARILFAVLVFGSATARAPRASAAVAGTTSVSAATSPPGVEHPNPRLKLSYRRFAVSNLDSTEVPLQGLQLDVYPLSRRWVRGGFEIEGGKGRAALNGGSADVRYGMLGVTAGFQYPARVTPFVEGRLVGGVMAGSQDGVVTVPGTSVSISGTSAATWITGRGLDFGAELFTLGRAYFSASIGWLRTTWGGVDYAAMMRDPSGGLRLKNLSNDSFTLKVGVGI
jgi:hypothetical protein